MSKSVSLKFNINKYINNPISRKPSLINVFTALDAAPAT